MGLDQDGIAPQALAGIDQEVVVTFRYPVLFTRALFALDNPTLRDVVQTAGRARLLVVVDEGVAEAHPALVGDVRRYCAAHAGVLDLPAAPLVVPGGEAIKNEPGPVSHIRAAIDVHSVDRHSYVVAIGGGAVLDAVGYAAATAHRGVRLIRVPTTVLSQDDSAVGVKNGINAFGKKNFVGSFAPPHAVLNDFDLLLTLQDRDWRAGISEAVKVALLKDAPFFEWIEDHAHDLCDRSLPAMAHMVHRSAELHLDHIATSGDPFELGSSRPLDFGHWAAHKLEQLSHNELRHGEAVAVGIALDSTYSYLTGSLRHADWRRIIELFETVELPIWHADMATPGSAGRPAVLAGLEEFREHLGGRLTVMLLERIGSGFEVHELDEAVLLEASDLLRRRIEGGDREGWEPTPALAR
ncbi:MAG TPA: 3-dehydroquinate synthase [Solirubrobacteraceae bacterium]